MCRWDIFLRCGVVVVVVVVVVVLMTELCCTVTGVIWARHMYTGHLRTISLYGMQDDIKVLN